MTYNVFSGTLNPTQSTLVRATYARVQEYESSRDAEFCIVCTPLSATNPAKLSTIVAIAVTFVTCAHSWMHQTRSLTRLLSFNTRIYRRTSAVNYVWFYYLAAGRDAKYCDERVCMCVCLSAGFAYISKTTGPNFTKFSVRVKPWFHVKIKLF